jgi:putative transport protein
MEIDVIQLLRDNPLLLTFFVIGLGYLLGRIKIGSVEVGSTTGVLLAGLLLGHLGFPDRPGAAAFGFTLFIFSVGLQAGPSFFSAFLEDGRRYVALSAVVAITAFGVALGISHVVELEPGMNAGLLAGALTSTPTLAGAQDAIDSGLVVLPPGMTAAALSANVSIGYALTYIFGTVGLILFIRYFPIMLGIDLAAEARALESRRRVGRRSDARSLPIIRAYQIPEAAEAIGNTVREAIAKAGGNVVVLRMRRGDAILDVDPSLEIRQGDVVSLMASLEAHRVVQGRIGAEILDPELIGYQIVQREIILVNPGSVGKTISGLDVIAQYGCFVTGITRASVDLPMEDDLLMQKGDQLHVTGEAGRLQQFADVIGYIEEQVEETDLLTFSFGVCAGIILGLIAVKLGSVSVGIGSAGGLLFMGIVIGFVSSLYPTFGRVPAAARFILMELGLMLFMAEVGLKAGGGIFEALTSVGPKMILSGMVVTLVPVLVGYAFGRYVLKLNPALLFGSITGAMTSTPSLNIVTTAARSSVPALGYAGTYTFANVMLTFAGTIMMML